MSSSKSSSTNLTERYVYAVTRRLPADMQADVADELLSVIEEMLEDKKNPDSKTAINEVLTTLGDPDLLAQKYSGKKQYLIGPKLFWLYTRALKLALAIGLPIALVAGLISTVIEGAGTVGEYITGVFGVGIGAGIQILFWTTAVFFVLERSNVDAKQVGATPWTPDMLPQVATKREIPLSESIGDAIWYALLVALPFVAQPLVGAHIDGVVTPFFNPEIWAIATPLVVAIGVIGIIKSLLKIKLGRWTKSLAIGNTLYALAFSAFLIAALTLVSLVNPAFLALLDQHITTSALEEVTRGTYWTVWISVLITVGIYLYDAGKSLYLAYRRK